MLFAFLKAPDKKLAKTTFLGNWIRERKPGRGRDVFRRRTHRFECWTLWTLRHRTVASMWQKLLKSIDSETKNHHGNWTVRCVFLWPRADIERVVRPKWETITVLWLTTNSHNFKKANIRSRRSFLNRLCLYFLFVVNVMSASLSLHLRREIQIKCKDLGN